MGAPFSPTTSSKNLLLLIAVRTANREIDSRICSIMISCNYYYDAPTQRIRFFQKVSMRMSSSKQTKINNLSGNINPKSPIIHDHPGMLSYVQLYVRAVSYAYIPGGNMHVLTQN